MYSVPLYCTLDKVKGHRSTDFNWLLYLPNGHAQVMVDEREESTAGRVAISKNRVRGNENLLQKYIPDQSTGEFLYGVALMVI